MRKNEGVRLYCFSPPVMVATLVLETGLALYTAWRYKMTMLTRLAIIMLVGLATFQLAEYFVCTSYGLHAEQWSRLGFIAISTLPPLGIHIMHQLDAKPRRKLVVAAYATMVGFIVFFLMYRTAFIGYRCSGNYVIFQLGARASMAYGVYYYGWLATGIGLGMRWANELLAKGHAGLKKLQAVRGFILGYLVFLIPTAIANTFKPETRRGIPSVMCGFAVLFALILVFYILPRTALHRRASKAST